MSRIRNKNVRFDTITRTLAVLLLVVPLTSLAAQDAVPATSTVTAADNAARFGALESISDISLSPDGNRIAYIAPEAGQSRALFVVGTEEGATPRRILRSSGDPEHLRWCQWATNDRLVCQVFSRARIAGDLIGASSIIAVDAVGGNVRSLSNRRGSNSLYADFRGGEVVDWLPQTPGSILMMRSYVPQNSTGSLIPRGEEGMGVDLIDVVSGASRRVESPRRDATAYISDGNGVVRVMASQGYEGETGRLSEVVRYSYRPVDGGNWRSLASLNIVTGDGIDIAAVDAASNSAIGFQKIDGRMAVVSMPLDGSGLTTTIFAHPVVDVDSIVRIGRTRRVVGVSFVTERRQAVVTDSALATMTRALSRALGGKSVHIVDTSGDEGRHLVWAGSDVDPGQYYLYTPAARQLRPLLAERPEITTQTLSAVTPVSYPAADGTMIPGYLTLPPGRTDARGLPAIVMPHGGPSARDEWGFDWLAQYFAAQGFAVLQPNFRGSSGYGDAWYQNNGFQSWRTAIGDVTDGGRWLLAAQGVDPAKLSIVGWSYGGYAALQSGVLAPDLFRAIVAIAPVTDLDQLRSEADATAGARIERAFIGSGPHIREGSPARNAAVISAPVLMFHGTDDQNVSIEQARTMRRQLQQAGKPVELIEYPDLAHSLGTAEARIDMLRRIAAFLPQ